MAASDYLTQVQQLYVAYFGRPADPGGLAYWSQQIDAAGGNLAVAVTGFSASAESQALYGNMTTAQKVTAIYTNLFNRAPEPAGLAFWTGLLDGGALSASQAALTILQSAGPGDITAITNKTTAAAAFTAAVDTSAELAGYQGANAAAAARAFLAKVDATPASVANLAVVVNTAVATATGATPPASGGGGGPSFSAAKDVGNAVTFVAAGAAITVASVGGDYTFTSSGITATITGTVTSITVPTGSALTTTAALAAGITFPGPGAVALSDTTAAAATLKALETAATGLLDASTVTSITSATAADAQLLLVTNNGSSGNKIKTNATVAVTLADTTATAAVLKDIETHTTGLVDAASVTSITAATVADAKQLLITDLGTTGDKIKLASSVAITLADTTATAADLKAIETATTGLVTATSITSITAASVADAKQLLITDKGSSGDKINLGGAVAVTLTDTTATAADLKAIETATTGLVDASTVASITGTMADALQLLVTDAGSTGDKIRMAANVAATLSDTTATAADLKAIETATTGVVDATSITAITAATVADAKQLLVTDLGTTGDKINLAGNVAVTLADTTATAADLKAIETATTGLVTATSITAITAATVADAKQLLVTDLGTTGDKINLAGNVAVTLADTTAVAADLKNLEAATTGLVDATSVATISAASVADAQLLLSTKNGSSGDKIKTAANVAIALADTTATGTALKAINDGTTGVVNASTITSITAATVAQAKQLLVTNAATVTLATGVTVGLTDTTATAADLKTIETATTGLVDATSITTITAAAVADALLLVTDRGTTGDKINLGGAVAVTLGDTSAAAADLVSIEQATTGLVDATTVTSITAASVANAKLLLVTDKGSTGDKINTAGNVTVILTGTTATAADLIAIETATTGLVSASSITSITGTTLANATQLLVTDKGSTGDKINLAGNVGIILVTDTTATATALVAIDNATTGTVNAATITAITAATAAQAKQLLITDAARVTVAVGVAVTLSDTAATAADLVLVEQATTGLVDASSVVTINSATVANAVQLLVTDNGTSGDKIRIVANAAVTVTDTTATATDLAAIEAATTGLFDASSVTTITGATAAQAQLLLFTNNGSSGNKIKTAANAAISLSDSTVTGTVLKAIDDGTTGVVTASAVTSLTAATVAQAKQLLITDAATVTLGAGVTVGLTDTTATAADLTAIETATTGLVDATSITAITAATVADAKQLLITDIGSTGDKINLAGSVAVTLADTTASAADLKTVEAATTGLVDASTITAITAASVADATLLLVTNAGTTGDKIKLSGSEAVTLTGTTATAAALKGIETATTGLVDASTVITLSGTAADVQQVLVTDAGPSGDKIKVAGNVTVTLSDTTATGTVLAAIDGATTSTVNAATVTSITAATAAQARQLLITDAARVTLAAGVTVALSDTSATAADLKAIEQATTGLLDASTVTAITAALVADAKLLLVTDKGSSGDKININGAVAVTLTDTSATAADLAALDNATTGLLDASTVTTLTGLAADANQLVFTNAGTTGDKVRMAANVAVTLSDTTSDAATLKSIETHTTGLVDASTVTSLTASTVADVLQILSTDAGTSGDKIKMAGNVAVTLSDTSASIADLLAVDGATTGLVDASSVTAYGSLTLAQATQLLVTENLTQWKHAANVTLTLTDTSATPTDLNAIDAATTGLVSANGVTALSGLVADVATTLAGIGTGGISATSLTSITLTDAVSAASFSSAVFNNNTTLNLASVTGNSLTLAAGNVTGSNTLTIDGSAATGSETLNAAAAISTSTLTIKGGVGDDTISPGKGFNTLTGGAGNDTFAFSAANFSTFTGGQSGVATDTITDYRAAGAGTDVISFTGFTPQVGSNWSTVQDFTTQGFVSNALNWAASRNNTNNGMTVFIFNEDVYVYVEATGSNTAYNAGDFVVKLVGAKPLFAEGSAIAGNGFGGL